jgi:hypothetical protein
VRGIILAWAIGEGIIIFRSVQRDHSPPVPGALLATSGLFALLAILAEAEQARLLATAMAFGVDIAALMNLWGLGGKAPATTATATATAGKAATAAPAATA